MDVNKTLQWLHDLCEQAHQEGRAGDLTLSNRLGSNPATKHYYDNVFSLHSITPQTWTQRHPQHLKAADAMREAYEQQVNAVQTTDRLTALEAKFDRLLEALEASKGKRAPSIKEAVEAESDDDEAEKADDTKADTEPTDESDEGEDTDAESEA